MNGSVTSLSGNSLNTDLLFLYISIDTILKSSPFHLFLVSTPLLTKTNTHGPFLNLTVNLTQNCLPFNFLLILSFFILLRTMKCPFWLFCTIFNLLPFPILLDLLFFSSLDRTLKVETTEFLTTIQNDCTSRFLPLYPTPLPSFSHLFFLY